MLKNKQIIDQLTLEEKASLLSGANFWNTKAIPEKGIPGFMLTDGPHGLRKQGGKADHLGLNKSIPATCFPTAATLANSWDVEMLIEVGETLAQECVAENVSVILGPGLNVKRDPLCGRNFEYFSEDPYLSGKLAAAMIQGIEGMGVTACPKHFAVNSQENVRMTIDEIVDERALREIYLEGFRIAVQEGCPGSIMSSYNKINGEFASENTALMNDILVDEWGFDGIVVTDWGGIVDRVKALASGCHLEMPSSGGVTDKEVIAAVREGAISESLLDERIDKLISLALKQRPLAAAVDKQKHHKKAIEFATRSMVLLKNDDSMLPIRKGTKVAIIGDFAITPRYQGAGSSLVEPTVLSNAYDALMKSEIEVVGFTRGFNRFGGKSARSISEATQLAGESEMVLLFLGLDESREAEGVDRANMKLDETQLELVRSIKQVNPRIVVILSGGAPMELPFADDVPAILHSYLGGQGSGEAVAALLMGDAVPCAKLAETYPFQYQDVPSSGYYPGKERTAEHRESIFVGYRYYDSANKKTRFPFGHGLSYTAFKYSDLMIDGRDVRFKVMNIGNVQASEIAQVYISKKNSVVFRAEQELKGFQKRLIPPGDTQDYLITLDEKSFGFYHVGEKRWVVEPGEYEIRVGASSRDIRLTCSITIESDPIEDPYKGKNVSKYLDVKVEKANSEDLSNLMGRSIPQAIWDRSNELSMTDAIIQSKYRSWLGMALNSLLDGIRGYFMWRKDPIKANNIYFAQNMRFDQGVRYSMGKVSYKTVRMIVVLLDKGLFKGIISLIRKNF